MTHLITEPESLHCIDFQDCDPFGHLNNTKYLNYIMHARTQHLKEAYAFDIYEHTKQTGNGWVVATSQISYMTPARYNENVIIKTRLLHADNLRIVPEAIMMSEDRTRIHAVAWVEFIYVNIERGRPVKHGENLKQLFDAICLQDIDWSAAGFMQRAKEIQKSLKNREQLIPV